MYATCDLYFEDLAESEGRFMNVPVRVRKMECRVYRTRDNSGQPIGHSLGSMELTVKLGKNLGIKHFLTQMQGYDPYPYTIVYDAVTENGKVVDYRNAMVFWGYIMSVDQDYDTGLVDSGEKEGTMLRISINLRDVKYLGKDTVKILTLLHS